MPQLVVNGVAHDVSLEPGKSLLYVLREELGLTGAKYGCAEGQCGACTVLVAGSPVRACVTDPEDVIGRSVTTVEGLAPDGELHPVQRAFAELGAMQCGYCTPGMILGTVALLATNPDPGEPEIKIALEGNICRCCTYPRIVRAVRRAAELMGTVDGRASARIGAGGPVTPSAGRTPWDGLPPDERDYFDLLGDGLVVVLPPARSGTWPPNGGAWIHTGANGVITAFTGKVDVGQDNRTALSLLVAEELRAPLEMVQLVMGDTDLCPFDVGTFGSRSMPDAGEYLRTAAAAARASLSEMASTRWSVDIADLALSDGRIEARDSRRSIRYGELLRGVRRVVIAAADTPMTPGSQWRAAGKPTPKLAARAIVTGAMRYPSDLVRPGMLSGKVLRPPSFGATLRSVDLTGAQALSGVTAVHEGSFVGVVAPNPLTAQRAIQAVHAEWNLVPQPAERDLIEHLRAHQIEGEGWEGSLHHEVGEPDEALAQAPVHLTQTYTAAYIAHAPLEPQVALAEWEGERLTVWTGTQMPFAVVSDLARTLHVAEARVRVVVADSGGGFGRHTGDVAIEAARLARSSRRPVKVMWSREEEFTWGYFRPAAVIDVRSGARADGTITAWEFKNFNSGSAAILAPYEIQNQRIDYQPTASPLQQGPYRALAATANHFARESHLDELAYALGIDPLEFRIRNLRDDRLVAVFRAAAERAGWAQRARAPGYGMGIAGGVEKGGRVATCVEVRVPADHRPQILRVVTAFECGTVVNPDNLINQIEGATVMGLGGALFEAIHFEAGRILNPSFSLYRVPRFSDVPPIEVVLLDRKDVPPAGGGETPIVAVAPALANAIFEATGVRLRSMPLLPGGILPEAKSDYPGTMPMRA